MKCEVRLVCMWLEVGVMLAIEVNLWA